ncbi:solute carrier family 26 member 11 [Phyllostomus discolor]|uniref:Sodium-independent sulfate anion transporter n=3 Tax=Phyllostomus discolor TaxID=89673 RepID=A0A6J2M488_9CHIR|nr:sodium-independent sulfate anion transporter [Phyllostomus discolor]XP_028374871.1 sodium-independent sulfate anion transporter [Phyllostomus discolor]XP_035890127.1 sodium-independent sulfate anion transporter [Phyllostomus discolor]KAF6097109.1 solute carrier family 26 member 11 [Phyllostomus discolor]
MSSSLKAMDRATPWPPGLAPMACCCSRATLQKWLPILAWLPDYSMQWLKMDLIAGLSVGLTVIPQALAYAEVAGLPAQYGLYSAFMGCFVYLLLGTSRDVTLGPTAIMSLLVSSYTFHEPAYAVLLAFLSGCIQLAMSFLGLGILLDFISCPVIKGFTSAAAITIAFGQIKNLLGLQHVPRQFFLQVYHTFRNIGQTRPGDVVLGMVCMLLLVMLKLMRGHVPPSYHDMPTSMRVSCGLVWTASTARNALVVSFAALIAYSFEVTGCQPFILTGKIVEGLPPLQVPPFSLSTANGTVSFTEMVQDMGAGLAVVPLMGLLESIAVARSFASQNSYRINTNQELLSIGLTNMLGSFFSSFPVTGSFGRTAVNAQSGVCTPAGGLVTGVLVLLSLDYMTSVFYFIPKTALAAVIITAVVPLVDTSVVGTLWRVKRLDLLPLAVTFLLCFWEVQYGILAGTLVSTLTLLYSEARPKIQVLDGEGPVLILQPTSGLHFPSVEALRKAVVSRALEVSPPRSAILECSRVCSMDATVALGLSELMEDFDRAGVTLVFVGLQGSILQALLAADLRGVWHFPTMEAAEKFLSQEPGTQPYNVGDESVPEHTVALLKA